MNSAHVPAPREHNSAPLCRIYRYSKLLYRKILILSGSLFIQEIFEMFLRFNIYKKILYNFLRIYLSHQHLYSPYRISSCTFNVSIEDDTSNYTTKSCQTSFIEQNEKNHFYNQRDFIFPGFHMILYNRSAFSNR